MKFLNLSAVLLLPLCLILASCEESDPVTGEAGATVLNGSIFTVDARTVNGNQLKATGTVKNKGTKSWSPVWVVEGEFYADSVSTFKLGGAGQSFTYSLGKGTSTGWELKLTSSQFELADYPHFAVKNLRVIQQD